ncbi:MAG: SPOR domain-containing protein [Saprospirales bacterium]|nr:SPOR domain-containing protein [Saprospirales bacterium]MBK8489879.1 SPOR domain-containing protein [Saprospirales bacterium]
MRFKIGFTVVLFSVWASISAFAQRNDQPVYTIYAGVFIETTAANFDAIRPLGFPYAVPSGNNMYRIYLGGFTNKSDADRNVQALRARGYQDAGVLELDPNRGQNVSVIQLDTKLLEKEIPWDSYSKFGRLNVILSDQNIKITTAVFPDINSAQAQLPAIRKMGFPDAFVKNVNSVFLHEINEFYPEAINTAPPPTNAGQANQTPRNVPANIPAPYDQPSNIPSSYNQPASIPPPSNVPAAYNQPTIAGPATLPVNNASLVPKPSIRSNIKRSSVTELQKILKDGGFYSSSLDGLYGKGTSGAYDKAVQANPQVEKYAFLAEQLPIKASTAQPGTLQYAIDNLADNPGVALPILQGSSLPVAKVYLAYYNLATGGPSQDVNNLMNSATLEAYAKAVRPPRTRFDYTSTYVFNDLSQILTPLAYVQVIANPEINTPCWLVQRHPKEAAYAFTPDAALPNANYKMPDCGGFTEWPEIRTLVRIAQDLNGGQLPDQKSVSAGQAQAMNYLAHPAALSDVEQKSADAWHSKMINGITGWASRDAMLVDMAGAFKLQYYQSYILLEDFYMNKGLKAAAAKGLAQSTLKALVGPYLTRFI